MSFLECPEAPVSEHSAAVKEFTGRKHYWNLFGRTFILDFPLIQDKLSRKTSLFVGCEILGLFGNTLVTDHMYSRHNWGKFSQHVETPLSQKAKKIFHVFVPFFHSTENFTHFQKKCQVYSSNSWEVIGSEKCACLNARKFLFQNTLSQWKCSRETNSAEIFLAGRLS